MHTSSRKKSDFYTFEAEAMRIEAEYKRAFPQDTVRRVLVSSGKDIARAINACEPGSIVSWDVLSHSNAGGIHISTDLARPQAASAERQRRHVEYRTGSRNPQSAKDAQFMEEDMRGMYTSAATTRLVADYFNQQPTGFANTLDELSYDRFSSECYVELHGCRTVNDDATLADLFIGNLSARLPCDATVVGHTGGSYPKGGRGYRHGVVGVFRAGRELHRGRRESLKLPNASTPGQDDEHFDPSTVSRSGSNGRTSSTGERRDFKTDWPRTGTPGGYPPRDNYEPPPRTGTPGTYPPPRDDYDPPRNTGTPGSYPPPRDDNNPNSGTPGSNPPRDDNQNPRGGSQGSEVPWGAILTGAAVVGGIALKAKRDRDRRRDSRDSRDENPRGSSSGRNTGRSNPGGMDRLLGSIDRGNPVGSITRSLGGAFGR